MAVPDWIEVVNKLATPTIAGCSAFYVFLQYRRAQRWKAIDLAAGLLERLNTDQALVLVCQALDWGVGPLIIPDQYRALFPSDASGEAPAVMQHDTSVLSVALEPTLNSATLSDPRGLVYRYCFIKFFDYLDRIYKLLESDQIRLEDIDELSYWVNRLQDYPYAPAKITGMLIFQPALKKWGYGNISLLGERLKATRGPRTSA